MSKSGKVDWRRQKRFEGDLYTRWEIIIIIILKKREKCEQEHKDATSELSFCWNSE